MSRTYTKIQTEFKENTIAHTVMDDDAWLLFNLVDFYFVGLQENQTGTQPPPYEGNYM